MKRHTASMAVVVLIVIVIWLAVMYAVGKTAKAKGRDPFWWVVLAMVIGVFAFLPLRAVGSTTERRRREVADFEELRHGARFAAKQLKELAELHDAGLISEEEFAAKRAALLKLT